MNNSGSVWTGQILQGKVNSNMANSLWHPGVGARIARVSAIALGVLLGGTMLIDISAPDGALAQGKKDAKAKDAKKDAKASSPESAWVKICDKGQLKGKDKEGKDVKVAKQAFVKTGRRQGGLVEITSGLNPGQTIVVAGQNKLQSGSVVMVDNSIDVTKLARGEKAATQ